MKKLYFILALVLFLLVGCAKDTTSVDSGDTLCITEPVTSAVTEMVTEPETTEATEITEQTEAVDTTNDSSVPFTGYTSPWTPSDLPVVVQSAPDSTAPFRFAARMEKSEFSADETIVIRASLINNGEPFTTSIYAYYPYCVLIRELSNGQYEKLTADFPIPDLDHYEEISSGYESIADYIFKPGGIYSEIIDADGNVLKKSFPDELAPGEYHILLRYQSYPIGYEESFYNCITIKETLTPIILQSDPDSTAPLRFIARMDKAEYTQDEPIIIRTTLINNGEPFTANIYTYFARCKLIRDLDDGGYEELMVDIPIPEGIEKQEIANGQASEETEFWFWSEKFSTIDVQRKSADETVLDEYRISSLEKGVYHLLLYYQNHLIPHAEYFELYQNCITVK